MKFAKYNPEPAENEFHYKNSWDFVQTTKMVEEISADNENKIGEGSL